MQKSSFFKGTLILLSGAFLTKLIGFIIKIYYTRMLSSSLISIMSIYMPTYTLLVNIATFTMPLTLSKLISANKKNGKKYVINAIYFILLINIIMGTILFVFAPFISSHILKNDLIKYLIYITIFNLPFISISSIIKGYFFGHQKMLPYAVSNVLEQVFRLTLMLIFLPIVININPIYGLFLIFTISIFTEISSIIIFMFFLPKNIDFRILNNNFSFNYIKKIVSFSGPTMFTRLLGSLFYFLEPLIIINLLLKQGLLYQDITYQYSLYNVYALTVLSLPVFIISAITTNIVPEVSKLFSNKEYISLKRRICTSLVFCFIAGVLSSLFIGLFGKTILNILYGSTESYQYLKILNFVFPLFYLEAPLNSILEGMGYLKKSIKTTLYGGIVKLVSLVLFILIGFNYYSIIYSEIVNIIFVIILSFYYIFKIIKVDFSK